MNVTKSRGSIVCPQAMAWGTFGMIEIGTLRDFGNNQTIRYSRGEAEKINIEYNYSYDYENQHRSLTNTHQHNLPESYRGTLPTVDFAHISLL